MDLAELFIINTRYQDIDYFIQDLDLCVAHMIFFNKIKRFLSTH